MKNLNISKKRNDLKAKLRDIERAKFSTEQIFYMNFFRNLDRNIDRKEHSIRIENYRLHSKNQMTQSMSHRLKDRQREREKWYRKIEKETGSYSPFTLVKLLSFCWAICGVALSLVTGFNWISIKLSFATTSRLNDGRRKLSLRGWSIGASSVPCFGVVVFFFWLIAFEGNFFVCVQEGEMCMCACVCLQFTMFAIFRKM